MPTDSHLLYEIEGCLNEAVTHLHEQQDVIADLKPTMPPRSLLRLHSIALRQFSWLEKERELLGKFVFQPSVDPVFAAAITRNLRLTSRYTPVEIENQKKTSND